MSTRYRLVIDVNVHNSELLIKAARYWAYLNSCDPEEIVSIADALPWVFDTAHVTPLDHGYEIVDKEVRFVTELA